MIFVYDDDTRWFSITLALDETTQSLQYVARLSAIVEILIFFRNKPRAWRFQNSSICLDVVLKPSSTCRNYGIVSETEPRVRHRDIFDGKVDLNARFLSAVHRLLFHRYLKLLWARHNDLSYLIFMEKCRKYCGTSSAVCQSWSTRCHHYPCHRPYC